LFNETLGKKSQGNPVIPQKTDDFQKSKAANKLEAFGSSDKPFKSFGVFEGLRHAHLTGDISMVYSIHGSNPSVIDLYGLFSHDDLGVGQPVNIKRQKSMDKKFKSQTFI
jgi:mRNA-degrading endonuclease YafQ of YafQ-DinJ toxin-antitoxin module